MPTVADWLLTELRDYVYQTLSAERLGKHGFFDARRVQDLVGRAVLHDLKVALVSEVDVGESRQQ